MAGSRRKTPFSVKKTPSKKRVKTTVDLGWKGGDDDEIDSDDGGFYDDNNNKRGAGGEGHHQSSDDDDSEDKETVEAKKVRLAREYLEKIEKAGSGDSSSEREDDDDNNDDPGGDDEEVGVDRVGLKLQKERLKREGVYQRAVADKLAKRIESIKLDIVDKRKRHRRQHKEKDEPTTTKKTSILKVHQEQAKEWVDSGHVTLLKGHDLTTTSVSLQADGTRAVSGSKDHSVILWDIEHSKRIVNLWEHWRKRGDDDTRTEGQVLSVACSDDGRYAAVGRKDATVSIFDIRQPKGKLVKTFTGHKSAITCLAFQTQTLQLFSGSEDRCIRHYNLDEMMYLETLYGHQFAVTDMDCHRKERPISVGRDRTARAWKLQEDTHMIFRGGAKLSPAECVSVIKDDWFLTGHENGQLCLWLTEKKKAIETIEFSHGKNKSGGDGIGNGIGSISTLKGSDLACTGSNDDFLRFWKVKTGQTLNERGVEALTQVPVHGYINDIDIGPKARFCVLAIGQEARLGRWNRVAKAKNRFGIVKLDFEETGAGSDSDGDEKEEVVGEECNEPAGVESYSEEEEI